MEQEAKNWPTTLWTVHQAQIFETAQESVSFLIPQRWICSFNETHHEVFQLWGPVLPLICLSYQAADAFYPGTYHEHPLLHVLKHREDDHPCVAHDSWTTVEQYLSFCSHQNCGHSLAWFTRHHMGWLHLSWVFQSFTRTFRGWKWDRWTFLSAGPWDR